MYDRHPASRNERGERNERNERNERDTERGDDYYNRFHGKNYGYSEPGNYRRSDHEYYGFRGGGSQRRRTPPVYDSYQSNQGSKYRPGKRYDSGWRRERDTERRGEGRSDGSELLDERRSTSRKFERDPKSRPAFSAGFSRQNQPNQARDHYKPKRPSERDSQRDLMQRDSVEQAPRDADGRDYREGTGKGVKQEQAGPEKDVPEKDVPEKDVPEKNVPEKEMKQEKKEPDNEEKAPHAHASVSDTEAPADCVGSGEKSESPAPDSKASKVQSAVHASTSNGSETKTPTSKSLHPSSPIRQNASSDSDCNITDTSVLSPIGNTTTDDFLRNMSISGEKTENPDDFSEAETVINETPYPLDDSKRLLRKPGTDAERRRIKRNIVISDNDASDSDRNADENDGFEGETHANGENGENEKTLESEIQRSENPESGVEKESREPTADLESVGNGTPKSEPKTYKIKRDSTGRSQLQRACKKGNLAEAQELVRKGANPNESDFGGFTCLHEAALAGHTDIVKFLISHGADVNRQALEAGDFETPLMDAAENKHLDTVSALLESGADPHICNIDGHSTLTKLLLLKEEDDEYDEILAQLQAFSPAAPRKVVEDPAESYFSDLVKKKNPSIYKYAAQGLKEATAEDFISNAFTLSKMPDILNLAARNGHVELVDILLGLNPGEFDINEKNSVGVNALLASVGRGVYEVTRFLLSKGADPKVSRDDGLSPSEIARYSVQYDPREVQLLEQAEGRKRPLSSSDSEPAKKRRGSTESDLAKEFAEKGLEKDSEKDSEKGSEKGLEKEPEKDSEKGSEKEPEKDSEKASKDPAKNSKAEIKAKNESPVTEGLPKPENEEQGIEKLEKSPPKQEQKDKTPEEIAMAAALLRAQEEQRIKAAEEAKIWQEKVQAKKKARREMFLQAEKEKERKRLEEEKQRIEQLKQQEIDQQQQKARAAEHARQAAAQMQEKKHALELECIVNEYPIGLREFVLGSHTDILRYTPLYVMQVAGRKCVVDLQIVMLVSRSVQDMNLGAGPEIDDDTKTRLWALFFEMVGVGTNGRVEKNGAAKFCKLQLHYLDHDAVARYVQDAFPAVYARVWGAGLINEVDMTLDVVPAHAASDKPKEHLGFIPPKFSRRLDILRTVQAANTPLW